MTVEEIKEPGFYWATLKHSVLPFAARTIIHVMENHKIHRGTKGRFYLLYAERPRFALEDYENFNGPLKEIPCDLK